MSKSRSPHDVIHRMFPETKLNISNVEQRRDNQRRKVRLYAQGNQLGIVDRGMVHEKILASHLGGVIIPYNIRRILECRNVIYLGPFSSKQIWRLYKASMQNNMLHIYLWWIGTDVYNAINRHNRYNVKHIKRIKNVTHLCVSEELKRELMGIGIRAKVLTLVPDKIMNKLPLPEDYTVAVYMPSSHLSFYRYKQVKEIIMSLPDIKFIVYGNKNSLDISGLKNVECRGWVSNTKDIFRDSSALLRLTVHDGFPKSIIESVMYGRYVITNHEFPHIEVLKNNISIIKKLREKPVLKPSVREYYEKNYNIKNIKDAFPR